MGRRPTCPPALKPRWELWRTAPKSGAKPNAVLAGRSFIEWTALSFPSSTVTFSVRSRSTRGAW